MKRKETVELGDKQYELAEMPLRRAEEFRKELKTHFGQFTDLFDRAPNTNVEDTGGVASIMRLISDTLFSSVETVTKMLFDYYPQLAADKEFIEENAVSSEVVDAFLAVLGLSFPFFDQPRLATLIDMIPSPGSKRKRT